MSTFDYVIVGGGSAGSVLAGRLSEDPNTTVCLLEAGGDGRDLLIRAPAGVVAMLPRKLNNWSFRTEPQAQLNNRRGYQPRGKALGGSSAINAMVYIRGQAADYDSWAAAEVGWGFDSLMPYFKQAEGNQRGASAWHGASGPLQVSNQSAPRPISEAFVQAAAEQGIATNDDFNGPSQEGAGLYQVTQFHSGPHKGERCSAAAAYLHPVMKLRPNLSVITRARAEKILFSGRQASAVQYHHQGSSHRVEARREVLLCGGAFNSPQLLLLSGIGSAEQLKTHNIPQVIDLPGVGRNLQDHLDFTLCYRSDETNVFGIGAVAGWNLLKAGVEWKSRGTGHLTTPFAEGGAFFRSTEQATRPDIQLHFVISMVDDHARKLHYGYGFSCHVCLLRPSSRGTVGLHSADPLIDPKIDPNYLGDAADIAPLVAGVKRTRQILESNALSRYRKEEVYTAGAQSDADWLEHIRRRADTIYHPVGTCKMGTDDQAVVDHQLSVHGLSGLRVVDASVMPQLISGNTNAAVIAIAERAAELIKKQ